MIKKMITFDDALSIVLDSAKILEKESVDIKDSLNRILAEDVISDIDMPPFDKSAMDGYACKAEDINADYLRVIETIPAGFMPQKKIEKGECSKIMTGAMVPEGADTVIIIEETEEIEEEKIKFTGAKSKGNSIFFQKCNSNICVKGEDIKKNQVVLCKGDVIKPQHIAVLATVGCTAPVVYRLPKVGVIATGTELIEPYEKADGPKIRNSNSYQLVAQIQRVPAIPNYYGIAEDTDDAICTAISNAIKENDVVIISGGVSMGDFDLVPDNLEKNGINLIFESIAIKPGKPVNYGYSEEAYCFGLPGNPVSTFVQFEILVKPFLYKLMGHNYKNILLPAKTGIKISRKKAGRESLIPVELKGDKVFPVKYHGSAHINAMCSTDFLLSIPAGISEIPEGTLVNVRQI